MDRAEQEQAWTEFFWAALFEAHTTNERDPAAHWRLMRQQRMKLEGMVRRMFDQFEQATRNAPVPAPIPLGPAEPGLLEMVTSIYKFIQETKERRATPKPPDAKGTTRNGNRR